MKFLPLVWRNLMRRKIRTVITVLSIMVAFVLFGALMAIRAAFSMGVDVAGADRLMMIHKVSLIQPLPRSYGDRIRCDRRRDRGDARQLVRRLLPGADATSSRTWRSIPRVLAQHVPGVRAAGGPEEDLAGQSRRRHRRRRPGEALQLEGRRSGAAAAHRSIARPDGSPWDFTSTASTTRRQPASTRRSSSSTTTTSTRPCAPRPASPIRSAGTCSGRRPVDVGPARQARSTRCSPTRRPRPRPRPRRRSSPTSPSRSATSARS